MESQEASQFELDQISAINMTMAGAVAGPIRTLTGNNIIPSVDYTYTVFGHSTSARITIPQQDPVFYDNSAVLTNDIRMYNGLEGHNAFMDTLGGVMTKPSEDNYNFFDTITLIK